MANVPLKSITFPGLANKYIIPQVDNTLTQQGQAADAKKVGDEIADLKDDLYEGGTGTETELTFIDGKYINVGGSGVNIGDTINISNPSTYSNLRYTIADCVEGDKFRLDGINGAASARAWAFLTSSNVLISRADSGVSVTGYITAPVNAGKVIIQDNFQTGQIYAKAYKVSGSIPVCILDNVVRFDKSQDLTGEQKAQARENIGAIAEADTLSDEIKDALLACFRHVVYTDSNDDYYGNLVDALDAGSSDTLSVTFDPTRTIYNVDVLDSLKQFLTVTKKSDGTEILDYQLSGSMNAGRNTITVTSDDLSGKFSVTVADAFNISSFTLASSEIQKITGQAELSNSVPSRIVLSSSSSRRSMCFNYGKAPYYSNGQKTDYYPIPIKSGTTKIDIQVTPSSQYIYAQIVYLNDLNDTVYKNYAGVDWSQGSASYTFSEAGTVPKFIYVNTKYNSSGSSYPTEPSAITISYT